MNRETMWCVIMKLVAEGGEDCFSTELRFERVRGFWLFLRSPVCPYAIQAFEYLGKVLVRVRRCFPAANTSSFP